MLLWAAPIPVTVLALVIGSIAGSPSAGVLSGIVGIVALSMALILTWRTSRLNAALATGAFLIGTGQALIAWIFLHAPVEVQCRNSGPCFSPLFTCGFPSAFFLFGAVSVVMGLLRLRPPRPAFVWQQWPRP